MCRYPDPHRPAVAVSSISWAWWLVKWKSKRKSFRIIFTPHNMIIGSYLWCWKRTMWAAMCSVESFRDVNIGGLARKNNGRRRHYLSILWKWKIDCRTTDFGYRIEQFLYLAVSVSSNRSTTGSSFMPRKNMVISCTLFQWFFSILKMPQKCEFLSLPSMARQIEADTQKK